MKEVHPEVTLQSAINLFGQLFGAAVAVQQAQAKCSEYYARAAELEGKYQELVKQVAARQSELKDIEPRVAQKKFELAELHAEVEAVRTKRQSEEAHLIEVKKQIASLGASLSKQS